MSRQHDQLERLTFFADAVFAIAMTLLVVEVKLPHLSVPTDAALGHALIELLPDYVAFLVSFAVLARFWSGHHALMGHVRAATPAVIRANLLMLLAVAFMPFPTAVVSQYGSLRVGIAFYAGWLLLLGLVNRGLIRTVARNPSLHAADADPDLLARLGTRSWIPIVIALGAFAAGMVRPIAGMAVLVVGSPLVSVLLERRAKRHAKTTRP